MNQLSQILLFLRLKPLSRFLVWLIRNQAESGKIVRPAVLTVFFALLRIARQAAAPFKLSNPSSKGKLHSAEISRIFEETYRSHSLIYTAISFKAV